MGWDGMGIAASYCWPWSFGPGFSEKYIEVKHAGRIDAQEKAMEHVSDADRWFQEPRMGQVPPNPFKSEFAPWTDYEFVLTVGSKMGIHHDPS